MNLEGVEKTLHSEVACYPGKPPVQRKSFELTPFHNKLKKIIIIQSISLWHSFLLTAIVFKQFLFCVCVLFDINFSPSNHSILFLL